MLPIGIDEWLEQGRKYKYFNYWLGLLEKELPEKSNLQNVSEYWSGYNAYRQEVINIINSHKTL